MQAVTKIRAVGGVRSRANRTSIDKVYLLTGLRGIKPKNSITVSQSIPQCTASQRLAPFKPITISVGKAAGVQFAGKTDPAGTNSRSLYGWQQCDGYRLGSFEKQRSTDHTVT